MEMAALFWRDLLRSDGAIAQSHQSARFSPFVHLDSLFHGVGNRPVSLLQCNRSRISNAGNDS